MGNSADAHDPSARFAGTSPRVARGGRLRHVRRLSFQPGIGKTSAAAADSAGITTVGLRLRFSTAAALMLTFWPLASRTSSASPPW